MLKVIQMGQRSVLEANARIYNGDVCCDNVTSPRHTQWWIQAVAGRASALPYVTSVIIIVSCQIITQCVGADVGG